MKRIIDPSREGGYPVTGETLKILGVDMPDYVNAILEDFTPNNSIVFLGGDYAYCKIPVEGAPSAKEIMKVVYANGSGLNKAQMINGAHFVAQVNHGSGDSDTVNGTTYTFTREDVILYVTSSESNVHPKVYTLDTLVKSRYAINETDYFNDIQASLVSHNIEMAGSALIRTNPVTNTRIADINLVFKYPQHTTSGPIRVTLPAEFLSAAPITVECYSNNSMGKPDATLDAAEITIEAPNEPDSGNNVIIHLIMHYQIVSSFDNWRTFNAG